MKQRIYRSLLAGISFGAANAIIYCTYALLFWYGARLLEDGEIDFVDLLMAILALMFGAIGLGTALADIGDQKVGTEAAIRIFRDIEGGEQSSIDGLSISGKIPETTSQSVSSIPRAKGLIELKNVSFVYPTRPDAKVCNHFNLTISPGETVALVGPSGSGKSTIINLLLRFYDPIEGEILLDGMNIKDYNIRWLRAQIGYVGQEPVLFSGSVLSNVLRGRMNHIDEPLLSLSDALTLAEEEYRRDHPPSFHCQSSCFASLGYQSLPPRVVASNNEEGHRDDIEMRAIPSSSSPAAAGGGIAGGDANSLVNVPDDILEACQAAKAHEFITSFPRGYETDIGEGSIMVSGG